MQSSQWWLRLFTVHIWVRVSLVRRMSGSASGTARKRPAVSGQTMVLRQSFHHPTGGGLAEASSQLKPLSGLALFERVWLLPEGRDLPQLMQAFRERFGVRFGRCLEMLQGSSTTPTGPGRENLADPRHQIQGCGCPSRSNALI